jgi:hypothetical protein
MDNMIRMPSAVDYSKEIYALPANTTNLSAISTPSNGTVFGNSTPIIFDLPTRSHLVPNSMYLRYKTTVSTGATLGTVLGTPAYTPFAKLEVLIGSSIFETISNYNVISNMLINTKLSISQKFGFGNGFGFTDTNVNGRTLSTATTESYVCCMPLGCMLSSAEQNIPLFCMPGVRIQLTTESLTNMFHSTTLGTTTAVSFSNLELCYDLLDIPGSEQATMSMIDGDGNINIKSQSYLSSTQSIPAGSSNNLELVYNQRLSSIKSAVMMFGKASNARNFDSIDITSSTANGVGGDYQFVVASQGYPQRSLSTVIHHRQAVFAELSSCWSAANDFSQSMAISIAEFGYKSADTPSINAPGKFYIGVNLEKVHGSGAIMSGISSQLSPISFRVNIGSVATSEAHSAMLVLCYDAIIQINPMTRQCTVKQ